MNPNDNFTTTDSIENASPSLQLIKRIIPFFVLILIATLLIIFFKRGCNLGAENQPIAVDSSKIAAVNPSIELDSAALKAKADWELNLGAMIDFKLPDGTVISIPNNGFEKGLIDFLANGCQGDLKTKWFNCDRLLFHTGSTELNYVSMEQIDVIAKIFNAFPTAKFKIGGYTDNVGKPESNLKLSNDRANSVMNAILKNGLNADKIRAEGYGQDYPECPLNDSDECRAKNRRVAIRVDQCH